jgi:hypothetical protein
VAALYGAAAPKLEQKTADLVWATANVPHLLNDLKISKFLNRLMI